MIIKMKLYETYMLGFDYEIPEDDEVLKRLESGKLDDLVVLLGITNNSNLKKVMEIKKVTERIVAELKTVQRLKNGLSVPEIKSDLPKVTYSHKHKMDMLVNLRNIKSTLDKSGFIDENGKSMYFDMPLPTCFHFYYKIISSS